MKKIREILTRLKNNNLLLYYIWTEFVRLKGKKALEKYTDLEAVTNMYFAYSRRYPNLKNPTLFSEKMQWLKLYYHNPNMEIAADKYEVRNFIKQKGYANLLNKLIQVFEKVEDIQLDKLPEKFVLKASHGSSWNLIVNNKSKINWFLWKRILKSWLKHNIFWNGREWVYKNSKPRLVCEAYLEDKSGALMDYKFHCFHGKPMFIQANNGRGQKVHAQNFYDLNWKLAPFGKDLTPLPEVNIPKPHCFKEMLKIAKDLAAEFLYVRVDFYEVNKKIIFGELTFFPASGMPDFKPPEYDKIWGDFLILPNKTAKINTDEST
ncbi:ATP-grasp fold amidoligase family protein [Lutibacter sp.]